MKEEKGHFACVPVFVERSVAASERSTKCTIAPIFLYLVPKAE